MSQLRRWLPGIAAVAAFAAACWLQTRLPSPPDERLDESFVPRPEVAKLASLGFDTALADYYWLRAVQVVGAALHPEQYGRLLGRYIDVVTTIDPWVDHAYRFAAIWLTASEEDVRHANRLLEKSLIYHPDDWRNRFYLGFNQYFYLHENVEAAGHLEEAARLPGGPSYLGGLAARLRAGEQGLEVSEALLRQLWKDTEDPIRRAGYERALDEVETERRARVLDAAREVFRKRNGRDIRSPEELASGPDAVLRRLPEELHGWEWEIDPESGEIVSSYYKRRYRPVRLPATTQEYIYGWSLDGTAEQGGKGARK